MEAIRETSSEIPVWSELVSSDDGRASKKLVRYVGYKYVSAYVVLTNDNLLTEILLRLPVISVHLFIRVSKQWLRIITSHNFTLRRSQIPNLDLPSGLFVTYAKPSFKCDFLSLDSRIRSSLDNSFTLGSTKAGNNVYIHHSCNGLLLCSGRMKDSAYVYVYNPSTNLFRILPQPTMSTFPSRYISSFVRLAFDPAKSLHYKVVYARHTNNDIQIQTYSSETCNWSISNDRFPIQSFMSFCAGIYWNDAIHWLHGVQVHQCMLKLDIVCHPILTTIQNPQGSHHEAKLFESRDCLVLLCKDNSRSRDFTIHE